MNLIRPVLLPDEHALGFEGRLNRLNGIINPRRTWGIMQAWAAIVGLEKASQSRAELLANVAGMELGEFLCSHTTFTYRCAFVSERDQLAQADGARPTPRILRLNALATLRNELYLCPECVAADSAGHGMSYWRRTHQLPGVFWCAQHGCALHFVDMTRAMTDSPEALLDQSTPVDGDWVDHLRGSASVSRFRDLGNYLSQRKAPLDERDVSLLVSRLARSRGIDTRKRACPTPRIAGLLAGAFDAGWLATTIPAVVAQRRKAISADRALLGKRAHVSTQVYVAALAAMVDSAEGAIALLDEAREESARVPECSRNQRSPRYEDVRDAYVAARGNVVVAGESIGLSKKQALNHFRVIGLPGLACYSRAGAKVALRLFLLEGRSLEESARSAGITLSDLEAILRTSAAPIREALAKAGGSSPRRREVRKPRVCADTDLSYAQGLR
ncbi:TniQ family protein [Metallibacterium sp.]